MPNERPTDKPMIDFRETPLLILWELTQACALACRHCRAEAQPRRHDDELSTAECFEVLEQIRDLGAPLVVLTGGDPAQRPDLVTLIEQGTSLGLRMALTPSATPRTTPALLERCEKAGLLRVAFSVDGADEAEHDRFRGVRGSWRRTLDLLDAAHRIGLSAQVNTTITRANADRFDDLAAAVLPLPIDLWSVFFAVPTGRASADDIPTAEQCEWVFDR
ncbi:MAG: radical SAM protein, partial [Myxococcales bacterium]|nr:radical SAM protein [Myxococcales bacterium]